MKRALLIAFHYPPVKGSSGMQRTLQYSRYLAQHDWKVEVLTVSPRAYESTSHDQLQDIPESVTVHRAFALDTKRHLSFFGRYPAFLARPDRWSSWIIGGIHSGKQIVNRFNPQVIWSTYPIASAHKIALHLSRKFDLPWVADFRDLMTSEVWPPDEKKRLELRRLETRIVAQATRCVFTAPGAREFYQRTYSGQPAEKFVCLPNGFDESSFSEVSPGNFTTPHRLTLLHAGILYPLERDPIPFYKAIASLRDKGIVSEANLLIRLRATGHDHYHRPLLKKMGIEGIVELAEPLPYREVLQEMADSDGLLIFQADNCNRQIPAKLYEYFRAGRPILSLTDKAGDTGAQVLHENAGMVCQLDDALDIENHLMKFLTQIRENRVTTIDPDRIQRYSRENQTADLARLLDECIRNDS